jgi:hypothetical protein
MRRWSLRWLHSLAFVVLAALGAHALTARADAFTQGDQVMLQFGPYVHHSTYDANHNDWPLLVGLEWESASRWEVGASYFKNSYYQPCVYAYVGKRWFWKPSDDGFYLKLTGGLLYGYKDPYEDKVPFNHNGLGLAALPGVGYQYQRANAQLVVLGTAGLMLTFGYDVWK